MFILFVYVLNCKDEKIFCADLLNLTKGAKPLSEHGTRPLDVVIVNKQSDRCDEGRSMD